MDFRISSRVQAIVDSGTTAIERNRSILHPNPIRFAGSMPDQELLPFGALQLAAENVYAKGDQAQPPGRAGRFQPLHAQLRERLIAGGLAVSADQLLIANHPAQALELAIHALTEPGDSVIVEHTADPELIHLLRLNGLHVEAAESDEEGLCLPKLKLLVGQVKPKLICVRPNFGAPSGGSWGIKRRADIVRLCGKLGIPILEDDPYGDLRFCEKEELPSLLLAARGIEGGPVISIGTWCKSVAPSFGTAWIIGDSRLIQAMASIMEATGHHGGLVQERLMSGLLGSLDIDAHFRYVSGVYQRRIQMMMSLLQARSLPGVSFAQPRGGMFLWVKLPDGLDGEALLRAGLRLGVTFDPGARLYAGEPERSMVRLNAAAVCDADIADGIERFAEAIEGFLARM